MKAEARVEARSRGASGGLVRGGRRLLRYLFVALVLGCWALLLQRNWVDISAREWHLDAGRMALVVLAFAVYFLGLGLGWVLTARAIGFPIPMAGGSAVWLLSMPARYVPGNVWHIASRVRLAQGHGVPAEGVLASSVLEQALTVMSAACLGAAWLPSWVESGWAMWTAAGVFAACLVVLQPAVLRVAFGWASRLLGRQWRPVEMSYRRLVPLFAWYGLVNAANGTAFAILAVPIAGVPAELWPLLASAYCLAYVIGYASFLTPSGIGVREAALTSMLVLYVPLPLAITVSLLARLVSTAGEAAAVCLAGLPLAGRLVLKP